MLNADVVRIGLTCTAPWRAVQMAGRPCREGTLDWNVVRRHVDGSTWTVGPWHRGNRQAPNRQPLPIQVRWPIDIPILMLLNPRKTKPRGWTSRPMATTKSAAVPP